MNCADAGQLLHAYVDAELDLASTLRIEGHLQECPRCRARESGLRAVRATVQRNAEFAPAPDALRGRLQARYGTDTHHRPRASVRRYAVAASVCAVLLVVAGGMLSGWMGGSGERARPGSKIVYHISQSDTAEAALRTLGNHLDASPDIKVVVVAHNNGVDFLLRGARNPSGELYAAAVRKFRERGVEFRVCSNTLVRRNMGTDTVLPEAVLVPSGIAEIGRLQSEEHYAYMRL